ncbi:MAG: YceI family protein [Gemmatimonadales bacterium]
MNKWMVVTAMWLLSDGLQDAAKAAPDWTAYTPRSVPSAAVGEGRLSFDGRATIGDFMGTTTTVRGEMTGGNDLRAVRGWVEAPVITLVTGNERRDKDLNKSMESDRYPTMRFELTGVTPTAEQGDTALVDLQGKFQIHGVEREVTIPATVVRGAGAIRVRSTTPMNLKDYRIGGLTKALGMLRMYEGIVLHIDVTFVPGIAASPASAGT